MKFGILLGSYNRQPKNNLEYMVTKFLEVEKMLISKFIFLNITV